MEALHFREIGFAPRKSPVGLNMFTTSTPPSVPPSALTPSTSVPNSAMPKLNNKEKKITTVTSRWLLQVQKIIL